MCFKRVETEDLLNDEQLVVIKTVMESVEQRLCKMTAVDASGGTWKTFTLSHILDKVRVQSRVALATAAIGIAATLLPEGTTFHSRLGALSFSLSSPFAT